MNLDTILETLKTYITANKLSKAEVAAEIGVTRVELSQWLSGGSRKPVADKAFQILKFLTKGNQPIMNTIQTEDDGLQAVNQAILQKYAAKGMQIKHFTSGLGLTENDGFVPQEGKSQPDLATSVAELIRAGNMKEATDLLKQVQKGSRVTPSRATRANVNVGSTRSPMVVKGDGSRAVETEDGLTFHTKNGSKCLDHSPETVAAAKKSLKSRNARVAIQTTKPVEKQIKFSGPMNPENVKMDRIRELQRNLATQSNDLLSLSIREE